MKAPESESAGTGGRPGTALDGTCSRSGQGCSCSTAVARSKRETPFVYALERSVQEVGSWPAGTVAAGVAAGVGVLAWPHPSTWHPGAAPARGRPPAALAVPSLSVWRLQLTIMERSSQINHEFSHLCF